MFNLYSDPINVYWNFQASYYINSSSLTFHTNCYWFVEARLKFDRTARNAGFLSQLYYASIHDILQASNTATPSEKVYFSSLARDKTTDLILYNQSTKNHVNWIAREVARIYSRYGA